MKKIVLLKAGVDFNKKGGITCKGYEIDLFGKSIVRNWGAIEITGRSRKLLTWAKGSPTERINTFQKLDDALKFMNRMIKRRLSHDYVLTKRKINRPKN